VGADDILGLTLIGSEGGEVIAAVRIAILPGCRTSRAMRS